MDVILDTNVYLQDPSFKKLEALSIYLDAQKDKLVLPEVVEVEAPEVFLRKIKEAIGSANRVTAEFRRLSLPEINTLDDDQVASAVQEFKERLGSIGRNLGVERVGLDPKRLSDLTVMAARRVKPFDDKGHGFRDAALWLSALQYAKENQHREIALISNDRSAFANLEDKKNSAFHPDLQEQLTQLGVSNLHYYERLDDFLSKELKKIPEYQFKPRPRALLGSREDLLQFEANFNRSLRGESRGAYISFERSPKSFRWKVESSEAFELTGAHVYVRAKVSATVPALLEFSVTVSEDYARDESYEEEVFEAINLQLTGTLSVRVLNESSMIPELLDITYRGFEYASDSVLDEFDEHSEHDETK
jgi:PIN domain